MYIYVHKYVYNFLQKILKFFKFSLDKNWKRNIINMYLICVFFLHSFLESLFLIYTMVRLIYTMVRQELPEPNACGHCVRPVNIVYMLTGSSGLKQEARLLVAE